MRRELSFNGIEYILGINFGEDITSAAIARLNYIRRHISIETVKILENTPYIPSEIFEDNSSYALSPLKSWFEKPIKIGFGNNVSEFSVEAKLRMKTFISLVYGHIRSNYSFLTDDNHFILLSYSDAQSYLDIQEYINLAVEANLPLIHYDNAYILGIINEMVARECFARHLPTFRVTRKCLVISFSSAKVSLYTHFDKSYYSYGFTLEPIEYPILDYLTSVDEQCKIICQNATYREAVLNCIKEPFEKFMSYDEEVLELNYSWRKITHGEVAGSSHFYIERHEVRELLRNFYDNIYQGISSFKNTLRIIPEELEVFITGTTCRSLFPDIIKKFVTDIFNREDLIWDYSPNTSIADGLVEHGIETISKFNWVTELAYKDPIFID